MLYNMKLKLLTRMNASVCKLKVGVHIHIHCTFLFTVFIPSYTYSCVFTRADEADCALSRPINSIGILPAPQHTASIESAKRSSAQLSGRGRNSAPKDFRKSGRRRPLPQHQHSSMMQDLFLLMHEGINVAAERGVGATLNDFVVQRAAYTHTQTCAICHLAFRSSIYNHEGGKWRFDPF